VAPLQVIDKRKNCFGSCHGANCLTTDGRSINMDIFFASWRRCGILFNTKKRKMKKIFLVHPPVFICVSISTGSEEK